MKQSHDVTIIYIITKLELGGAQKVCLELFRSFDTITKTLLISGTEGILVPTVSQQSNAFLLDSFKREVSLKGIWLELKNFIRLISFLRIQKKNNPQCILHTHSTKAGIIGRWAGFFAGIPYRVHTVHGFGFHAYQSKVSWFIHYSLELITSFITNRYICVSSSDIKLGRKVIPFFNKKHVLIRAATLSSVEPAAAVPLLKKNNAFIFGTIACFKKQKNIFDLLKAFRLCYMKNNKTRLEIIGDGNLRPDIEQWIQFHHLEKSITLHGWQDDVHYFLKKWDTFVLSSLWEGLPCAIVEARLYRLPVIAYETGGIKDIIHHEKNGFLCPPQQYTMLSEYMLHLSANPLLHKTLSLYQDDLEPYSTKAMINAHIRLYESLLS